VCVVGQPFAYRLSVHVVIYAAAKERLFFVWIALVVASLGRDLRFSTLLLWFH
jgi:hypothetical protein